MKILIMSLVAMFWSYALTGPISLIPESDLEMGQLGDGDSLQYSMTNITLNPPYNISFSRINFTYITAKESGKHPDARAKLLEGGPGYSYVMIQFIAGPSGNYNYTVDIYGFRI